MTTVGRVLVACRDNLAYDAMSKIVAFTLPICANECEESILMAFGS